MRVSRGGLMAIIFYIPGPLREHTDGRSQVEIDVEIDADSGTLREVLAGLWQKYPGLRDRIVTEQGDVRQHVNIFVNEENMRDCGGFAATVGHGATITIVPAVSGG